MTEELAKLQKMTVISQDLKSVLDQQIERANEKEKEVERLALENAEAKSTMETAVHQQKEWKKQFDELK